MALYAIGDTHLSLSCGKSMEKFGGRWIGYVDKLRENLSVIQPDDTVVLCGDLSWGMSFEDSKKDFEFLNNISGRKIVVKGNHDFWWNTVSKMNGFFKDNNLNFEILHNNSYIYNNIAICGTRGWFIDEERDGHNEKLLNREVIRLETSLKSADNSEHADKYVFLHYPPIYDGYKCQPILNLLEKYEVKHCIFGHLHGASTRLAFEGLRNGTRFTLVSADYLNFIPKKILD